jgi:hypothetical protein
MRSFEAIATNHGFSAVDMDFDTVDLNDDKRISLDEWESFFLAIAEVENEEEAANTDSTSGRGEPGADRSDTNHDTDSRETISTTSPRTNTGNEPGSAADDMLAEEDFFRTADLDGDGNLNKKEFYGAVMNDADVFDALTGKRNFSSIDMDFDATVCESSGCACVHVLVVI